LLLFESIGGFYWLHVLRLACGLLFGFTAENVNGPSLRKNEMMRSKGKGDTTFFKLEIGVVSDPYDNSLEEYWRQ
jgi:hypothetical protein